MYEINWAILSPIWTRYGLNEWLKRITLIKPLRSDAKLERGLTFPKYPSGIAIYKSTGNVAQEKGSKTFFRKNRDRFQQNQKSEAFVVEQFWNIF